MRRLANSLMFEIHDSVQNLTGSTPTRQLIVARAPEYLDRLAQEESGDNPTLQRELATAYEKVGDTHGNPYVADLGDTDGALASYRKAEMIRQTLARAPAGANVGARMELGRGDRGLGDILGFKGDTGMLACYRRSLAPFQKLAAVDPADAAARDELARAWETLGDGLALTPQSAPTERLECFRRTLEIRQQPLAFHPADRRAQRSLGLAFLKVGQASAPDPAAANLRQASALLEQVSAANPEDARARREVGFAGCALGNAQAEADPKNAQARFDLMTAHADLAEALTGTGAPVPALAAGRPRGPPGTRPPRARKTPAGR